MCSFKFEDLCLLSKVMVGYLNNWYTKNMRYEMTYHLQECQVTCTHIIEVDLHILPANLCVACIHECKAFCLVVDNVNFKILLWCLIEAVIVLPSKQVDTHNTEDQPEDQTHQQHIHNGGNGTHQSIHDNLQDKKTKQNWGKWAKKVGWISIECLREKKRSKKRSREIK